MPAEYAFDQLKGFLDPLQCGQFAYSAGFPYIRGGNSPPPNVPNVHSFLVTETLSIDQRHMLLRRLLVTSLTRLDRSLRPIT